MDPGRAAVAGPGVGADDALAVQGGPQPFVADVVLDHLGDGRLEDDVDGLAVAGEELLELAPVGGVADPGVAPAAARSARRIRSNSVVVGLVALDVAGGELGDGRGAARRGRPTARSRCRPRTGTTGGGRRAAPGTRGGAARARRRPTGAEGRPSRRTGSRATPGRGRVARGCRRHRAGCAVRGRARCDRPGRDRRPRSARCGRLRPRRRPSAGPRSSDTGAGRPTCPSTSRVCTDAMLAGRDAAPSGPSGPRRPATRRGWSRIVEGTSDRSLPRRARGPPTDPARSPKTSDSSSGAGSGRATQSEDLGQGHARVPRPQQAWPARPARSRRPAAAGWPGADRDGPAP